MSPRTFARRRPVTAFLVLVFGLVWPALGIPRLGGHSVAPRWEGLVLSGLAFVVLFGGAVLVTAVADGRTGVRHLLAGITRWRIGGRRWLLVTGALPVLTLAVAGASGTLRRPPEGWLLMSVTYLVPGLVVGALLTNVWEETAWAGFVQRRLETRHGLLAASMLTAVPFTLMHVPGTFQNTPTGQAVVTLVAVAVLAPFLRYLLGVVLLETGSILAVGMLHASFNAAGQLSAAAGGWESLPALLALVLAVAGRRRLARRAVDRRKPTGDLIHQGRSSRSRRPHTIHVIRAASGWPGRRGGPERRPAWPASSPSPSTSVSTRRARP